MDPVILLGALARRFWRFSFIRFAAVGSAGFLVNAVALSLALKFLDLGPRMGWFIAFIPSVTFTWWGNRTFTFPERASTTIRTGFHEWARFVVTNGFGALVNFATYSLLVMRGYPPSNNPILALAVGVFAGLAFNFTFSKMFVFRRV